MNLQMQSIYYIIYNNIHIKFYTTYIHFWCFTPSLAVHYPFFVYNIQEHYVDYIRENIKISFLNANKKLCNY